MIKQAKDVDVGDVIVRNGSKLKVEEVLHFNSEVWLQVEGREEPVIADPSFRYEVRR